MGSPPARMCACAVLLAFGLAAPAGAAPPRDPDDLPPLPPPHAQPRTDDARWDPPTATGHAARRRVSVSLVPSFASFFRARFLGRPDRPARGGGAGLEADIHLIDPVWLRLVFSHTAHPVEDEFATGEDEQPV